MTLTVTIKNHWYSLSPLTASSPLSKSDLFLTFASESIGYFFFLRKSLHPDENDFNSFQGLALLSTQFPGAPPFHQIFTFTSPAKRIRGRINRYDFIFNTILFWEDLNVGDYVFGVFCLEIIVLEELDLVLSQSHGRNPYRITNSCPWFHKFH